MNNSTVHTGTDHTDTDRHPFRTLTADILHPSLADADPSRRRLLLVRQVVAFAGATGTLVQVIVWLMIALLGGGLAGPWWLWTAVPAAAAVAALTAAVRPRDADRHA